MKNDQSITEEKPMKYRYQCYDNLFKKPSCLELNLQFKKQSIKICTHFFFHFKALWITAQTNRVIRHEVLCNLFTLVQSPAFPIQDQLNLNDFIGLWMSYRGPVHDIYTLWFSSATWGNQFVTVGVLSDTKTSSGFLVFCFQQLKAWH